MGNVIRILLVLLGAVNIVMGLTVTNSMATVAVGAVVLVLGLLWMKAAAKKSAAGG